MRLEAFGYDARIAGSMGSPGLAPGRVVAVHRERCVVATADGETSATVSGAFRHASRSREDLPAVGDWVALDLRFPDCARVEAVLPRRTVLARRASGSASERQIVAANVDMAFLVQAVDGSFSANRLDRFASLCASAKVAAAVVLTKIDAIAPSLLDERIAAVRARHPDLPLAAVTCATPDGYRPLERLLSPGATHCLLGSSGAGKSTLANALCGEERMPTGAISASTAKGRHVTVRRELVLLRGGALLIDNPGMREVGVTEDVEGGAAAATVSELARACRYRDCGHVHEKGCAVRAALASGLLDAESWENHLRLEREAEHHATSAVERRRREREFGRLKRDYGRMRDRF